MTNPDTTGLLLGASTVPINDVDKLPWISAQLKLKQASLLMISWAAGSFEA
jgi:hypothetical protein